MLDVSYLRKRPPKQRQNVIITKHLNIVWIKMRALSNNYSNSYNLETFCRTTKYSRIKFKQVSDAGE